jgi:hypothetical protein
MSRVQLQVLLLHQHRPVLALLKHLPVLGNSEACTSCCYISDLTAATPCGAAQHTDLSQQYNKYSSRSISSSTDSRGYFEQSSTTCQQAISSSSNGSSHSCLVGCRPFSAVVAAQQDLLGRASSVAQFRSFAASAAPAAVQAGSASSGTHRLTYVSGCS